MERTGRRLATQQLETDPSSALMTPPHHNLPLGVWSTRLVPGKEGGQSPGITGGAAAAGRGPPTGLFCAALEPRLRQEQEGGHKRGGGGKQGNIYSGFLLQRL